MPSQGSLLTYQIAAQGVDSSSAFFDKFLILIEFFPKGFCTSKIFYRSSEAHILHFINPDSTSFLKKFIFCLVLSERVKGWLLFFSLIVLLDSETLVGYQHAALFSFEIASEY